MDLDGRFHQRFPFFLKFLNDNSLRHAVSKNIRIMSCLINHGEQEAKFFQDALIPGNDPRIVPKQLFQKHGNTPNNSAKSRMFEIEIAILRNHHWSKICEEGYGKLPSDHPLRTKQPTPSSNSKIWEELITTVLLHELVHFANNEAVDKDSRIVIPASEERGFMFENCSGLKSPLVPDSPIEKLEFWAEHSNFNTNPMSRI